MHLAPSMWVGLLLEHVAYPIALNKLNHHAKQSFKLSKQFEELQEAEFAIATAKIIYKSAHPKYIQVRKQLLRKSESLRRVRYQTHEILEILEFITPRWLF